MDTSEKNWAACVCQQDAMKQVVANQLSQL